MNEEDQQLIERFIDDDLSADEIRELSAKAEIDKAVRDELMDQLKLVGAIHALSMNIHDQQKISEVLERVVTVMSESPRDTENDVMLALKKDKTRSRYRRFYWAAAAIAAVCLLAFTIFQRIAPKKTYAASIVGDSSDYLAGDKFNAGSSVEIQKGEKAVLQFKDSSRLTLYGPLKGTLLDNGIDLESGYLSAEVNKQKDKHFQIITPHSTITVLGTAFDVSAMASSTELSVVKGKVKIAEKSKSLTVQPGEFVLSSENLPFEVYKQNNENLPESILKEKKAHSLNKILITGPQRIYPSADAFVRSGGYTQKNYGDYTQLIIAQSEHIQNVHRSFIRFDLSEFSSPVSSAKLKLFVQKADLQTVISIKVVSDDSWDENTITWVSAPEPAGEDLLSWDPKKDTGNELDVTAAVNQQIAGDKQITLYFYIKENTSNKAFIHSKDHEDISKRPVLLITP